MYLYKVVAFMDLCSSTSRMYVVLHLNFKVYVNTTLNRYLYLCMCYVIYGINNHFSSHPEYQWSLD